jgi:hypothetical protein
MAFPDRRRLQQDQFFLGAWSGPPLTDPKPKRREAGFLFRIERDGDPRILVQSVECPDWRYAFQNAPHLLTDDPQMREFDPTPQRDEWYRFRLLANVVKSKSAPHPAGKMRTTRSGLTIPCRKRTEVLVHPNPVPDSLPKDAIERDRVLRQRWDPWRKWLDQLGAKHGFRVVDRQESPLLMQTVHTAVRNRKGANPKKQIDWRYNAGLFEGVLICIDPDQLRDAITNGIGPAKAFGFGLLSVARV